MVKEYKCQRQSSGLRRGGGLEKIELWRISEISLALRLGGDGWRDSTFPFILFLSFFLFSLLSEQRSCMCQSPYQRKFLFSSFSFVLFILFLLFLSRFLFCACCRTCSRASPLLPTCPVPFFGRISPKAACGLVFQQDQHKSFHLETRPTPIGRVRDMNNLR